MPVPLPPLSAVENALRETNIALPAPELHGAISGWLAGGGDSGEGWLARVLADAEMPTPKPGSTLAALLQATHAQYEDGEFGFDLLMPDAGAALVERSGALFDWCRGFLGGFGLAVGDKLGLSEEGMEALDDLARLAAAQPEVDGDEEDEAAMVELEEFVRVAALLLHGDRVLGPRHRNRLN